MDLLDVYLSALDETIRAILKESAQEVLLELLACQCATIGLTPVLPGE